MLLVIAGVLFLSAPLLLMLNEQTFDIALPEWIVSKDRVYYAGGEGSPAGSDLDLSAVLGGAVQENLENAISRKIPGKTTALLGYAELQRHFIAASNSLFGWSCYPTFFGSDQVYSPSTGSQFFMPERADGVVLEKLGLVADGVADVARSFPDTNFIVYVVDSSRNSIANPAFPLVGSPISTEDGISEMRRRILDLSNVQVLGVCHDDEADYLKKYYRTDHHWNGFGTLEAYNEIAVTCDLASYETSETVKGLESIGFNGSYARRGLMPLNEEILEPVFPTEELAIKEGTLANALLEDGVWRVKQDPLEAEFRFYERWYGDNAVTVIQNKEKTGTVFLIANSYGASLRWLLASNYETTICWNDLYYSAKDESPLSGRISRFKPNAVYFVADLSDYSTLLTRSPRLLRS